MKSNSWLGTKWFLLLKFSEEALLTQVCQKVLACEVDWN